jgi:hypothetical protein
VSGPRENPSPEALSARIERRGELKNKERGQLPKIFWAEQDPSERVGNIRVVDEATLMTTRRGVFAGGDIVAGASTVILAMGHGRRAAAAIDAYLKAEAAPSRRSRRASRARRRGRVPPPPPPPTPSDPSRNPLS